jgi:hypothetical protein
LKQYSALKQLKTYHTGVNSLALWSHADGEHLDHVFGVDRIGAKRMAPLAPLDVAILRNKPDPSDHFGVLVDLQSRL